MPDLDSLLPDLDARFERLREEAHIPGVAWGVVRDGEFVHAGGAGTIRDGEDRLPGADSVYRIASMTKSFTAATVLLLRDEGRLRLDEPVSAYVPQLAGWRPPTADSRAVTVRDLLTMSAGLPTDDPWGDRQQGLDLDRFAELLAAGPVFAWPTGTVFEYSNLGYGILGRVITNVAGAEYREVVRDRLLRPLGMSSTGYLEAEVPAAHLAHGYVRRDDAFVREGTDGYGALASMGGVYTSVRDLARWVAGFLDAFPARDDPEGPHPLRRASRREMQQLHRLESAAMAEHPADGEPAAQASGYGFGLFVYRDPDVGTRIAHAGGYPGFGTHMAWHPATGLGVIGLANLRYAPIRPVVDEMLALLVRSEAAPRRRVAPAPATHRLRAAAERLLDRWDDALADEVFAMNMDLDEPREARRAAVARIVDEIGALRVDDSRPQRVESPAEVGWWMRGERGWARVSLLVTPEPSTRIQQLKLTSVGDPSPALRAIVDRVLALASMAAPAWPDDLALAEGVDRAVIERLLRAAGARFGSMRPGLPVDGDGRTATTMELETERGCAALSVTLAAGSDAIAALSLVARRREADPEPW